MSDKKSRRRFSTLPPIDSAPCMELSGNREVVLEGSRGVLEYTPEIVRVNTVGMIVSFHGRELDLRCISPSALIIGGFITSIDFII